MRRLGRVLDSASLLPAAPPAPQSDVGGWVLPTILTHPLVTRVFVICGSQALSHPHWPGASVGLRPALTPSSAFPPPCMPPQFFTCLVILFACEVAAGIWGFVNKDQVSLGPQGGPVPAWNGGSTCCPVCGGQAFGAPPEAGLVGRLSGGGGGAGGWGWVCPGHDTVPGEPGEGASPRMAPLCL